MSLFQFSRRAPGRSTLSLLITWSTPRFICMMILKLLYRIRVAGAEHIPRTGGVVYVSNHQSHYDPPIVAVLSNDRPYRVIARSGLFRFKPFGWLITVLGSIPVDRNKGDTAAMRAAIHEIDAGRTMLIFAEGGRTPDGILHPLERGVTVLLKRSRATVVPIAIEGVFDIWPKTRRFPRLTGRIRVKAAPAIEYEELMKSGPDAALERLRRTIELTRLELRESMRRESSGRYPVPGLGDRPYWDTPEAVDAAHA